MRGKQAHPVRWKKTAASIQQEEFDAGHPSRAEGAFEPPPHGVHFPIAFWLAALTSILALILCAVAFFGRRYSGRVLRTVFFVGLLLVAGLLTVGSDRGGQLVYQYGISVQTVAAH